MVHFSSSFPSYYYRYLSLLTILIVIVLDYGVSKFIRVKLFYLFQKLLNKNGNTIHRKNEIVPCCSPTQLSPIQLLYVDSNNTITQKTLPNMVVEACGCM